MAFETIHGALQLTRLTNESAEYRARREELRLAEIDLMQRRERVAELRRSLPLGATVPDYAFDSQGVPRRCQAMTRKGKPCQRQPLPGSEYCPSHQHLTESFEDLEHFEDLEQVELAA